MSQQQAKRPRTDGGSATSVPFAVLPFAGSGVAGHLDGPRLQARLNAPGGISEHTASHSFFFTDDHAVRRISKGNVTTLCGGTVAGCRDGTGTVAMLNAPAGIAAHPDGGFVVCDCGNDLIRRVTSGGQVTTLGGPNNFSKPYGIAPHPQIHGGFVVCKLNEASALRTAGYLAALYVNCWTACALNKHTD